MRPPPGDTHREAPPASPFHDGELAVQARAGVLAMARRVGGIIAPSIAPPLAAFLSSATLAAVGAVDDEGLVWASLLVGPPGFLGPQTGPPAGARGTASGAPDAPLTHLVVAATPASDDALRRTLTGTAARPAGRIPVGLVAIDLATRRRVRANGRLAAAGEDGFVVVVEEAYVNCPKYIQARTPPSSGARGGGAPSAHAAHAALSSRLGDEHRAWIGAADTLFVASVGPGGRADASHRGGPPGFVAVLDADHLVLPDYGGNAMFNTLGNLAVDPRVGLVVPDFARGRLLQLTGTATIDWRPDAVAAHPGAERVVVVAVEGVREVAAGIPAGWSPPRASPFNPTARAP